MDGQRLMITLGNGLMTRYVYDLLNFRLLRMKTEGYALDPSPHAGEMIYEYQSGTTKQDFAYSYDTLGNIINIVDATPDAGVGGTGTLSRDFDYDALYRLLQATGRENLSSPPYPSDNDPYKDNTRGTNAIDTTGYTQKYQYDVMGNIQELKHTTTSGSGNFNRIFNYDYIGDNNYLNSIDVWGNNYSFQYDFCGNQTLQNMDRNMAWDYADRMKAFYIWTGGTSEPTQYAQYGYDASGQRVMKVVRVAGGAYKVRIYIGSIFEEYYEYTGVGGTFLGYQDEIMIMDNQSKIASKLIGTTYSEPYMGIKYIFPDHLGSSNVQCKSDGSLYNREEYYPFGETSFGSYGKKRYRFCGKERDEESGMYYYGARYYLSWTCRFVSVDPLAAKFPWSSYVYAANNPICFDEPTGMNPTKPSSNGIEEGEKRTTQETVNVTYRTRTDIYVQEEKRYTDWYWHAGSKEYGTKAGWYQKEEYEQNLYWEANDFMGYMGWGWNSWWTNEQKNNVANSRLAKFLSTNPSDFTKDYIISTAKSLGDYQRWQASGFIEPSNFNVEDFIGLGLLLKAGLKTIAAIAAKRAEKEAAKVGSKITKEYLASLSKSDLLKMKMDVADKAWAEEKALVELTGSGSRRWSEAQIEELLKTGKVKGFEAHHINSIKGHPELISDPNNIEFLSKGKGSEHLAAHGGNTQNSTSGQLINRNELIENYYKLYNR